VRDAIYIILKANMALKSKRKSSRSQVQKNTWRKFGSGLIAYDPKRSRTILTSYPEKPISKMSNAELKSLISAKVNATEKLTKRNEDIVTSIMDRHELEDTIKYYLSDKHRILLLPYLV
jgi:hypothetical protein